MLSERTKSLIMGISSRNLVTLLILTYFFELQTVFTLTDEQFHEEWLPAFPEEHLSASPDRKLLVYPDEQFHAGSDCESLFCVDPVNLLNSAGNGLRNLLPFGQPSTQPKPTINLEGTPDVPPIVDPQIELFELAPNTDTQKCKPVAASNGPGSADQQVGS